MAGGARTLVGLVLGILLTSTGCTGIERLSSDPAGSGADEPVSADQREWMETSRVEGLEDLFAATPECRAVDPGEKGTR